MLARILIPILALICLLPQITSGHALFLGCLMALTLGNPYLVHTRKLTPLLLQFSVVGLGAGMNLPTVARVGAQGIGYTIIGIIAALALGFILQRLIKTEKNVSILISVGTAICGGSAIAAVAPVIRAKQDEIAISLAVVFTLNAVALFVFPPLGHIAVLNQNQFGLWSALAIHDTSSVVGAALQYGGEALEVATTVKLARALWIVPLAFGIGLLTSGTEKAGVAKKPWFILWFLVVAAVVTFIPQLQPAGEVVNLVAKRILVIVLFLIGAGITRQTLKQVGARPLVLGISLWFLVASGTLGAILAHWIR